MSLKNNVTAIRYYRSTGNAKEIAGHLGDGEDSKKVCICSFL